MGVEIVVLMGLAAVAGMVSGCAGFGAALVLAPAALAFGTPAQTLGILVTVSVVTNLSTLRGAAKDIDRVRLGRMTAGAFPGSVLGAIVLHAVDKQQVQVLLCVCCLAGVAVVHVGRQQRRTVSVRWAPISGTLSGAMATTVGPGGPPVVLYLTSSGLTGATQRATSSAYFLACAPVTAIAAMWVDGPQFAVGVAAGLALAPAVLAGNRMGLRLFERIGDRGLYRMSLGLVAATAAMSGLAGLT